MAERVIRVEALARVEGEGALHLSIAPDGEIRAELRLVEPPRFFEALLRGRHASEAPDVTARICGICPVAYVTSACHAVERAWGVETSPEIQALRRLLYCGEWIQSHALHAAMLHAPDFLGLPDAVAMAKERPETVRRALRLKKLGNALMETIGGRPVHPVNTRLGGFFRAPARSRLEAHVPELEWGVEAAEALALEFAAFDFPEDEGDDLFLSLVHPDRYPIEAGRIAVSGRGTFDAEDFESHVIERQVDHSTALHGRLADGSAYLTGPLARWANNFDRLTPDCRALAARIGLGPVTRNPFRSILVRLVEVRYACEEALRLIRAYAPPTPPAAPTPARAGGGAAGPLLARLPHGRRRSDRKRAHRPADVPEPTSHRGRPRARRPGQCRARRCGAQDALRTRHPQSRPVHFVRHPCDPRRNLARLSRFCSSASGVAGDATTARARPSPTPSPPPVWRPRSMKATAAACST